MLVDTGLELLDEDECRRLLGVRSVGRIGVSVQSLPAIFPVNYRLVGDRILFRTAVGTKFDAAVAGAVVGFEVDWFDSFGHEGWSVLVVGRASIVPPEEDLDPTLVRPWADGDRHHLVAIAIELISGRRIRHDMPVHDVRG
ncbi:MAG TPA: pyridoxamine 5'-phosphate oxidase family protein [Acidimicrobiales bacterium]|nr:pyridoxamine 5'-phosphate oxidase family protein [Acidimicrobiales bacterium]